MGGYSPASWGRTAKRRNGGRERGGRGGEGEDGGGQEVVLGYLHL